MSTLHCSSISLGYMNPSTPGIIIGLLSNRTVQVLVIDLRLGRHLGLQDHHFVFAQEFVDRILGVLEIDQLARAGGTGFAACGGESLGDAVVAEGAFVDGLALGVEVAATVGTGLDAIAAAEAVIL